MKKQTIALVMLGALIPVLSHADTATYNSNAALNVNGTGTYTTTAFSPSIPQFDPSLGTLTNVAIFFDTSISTTFQGTYSSASGSRTLSLSSVDTLTFAGRVISFNGNDTKNGTFTNGAFYSLRFSYGGGRSDGPTDFTPFIGTGNLPAPSWRTQISFSGAGFFSFPTLTGTTTARVRVIYTYTP